MPANVSLAMEALGSSLASVYLDIVHETVHAAILALEAGQRSPADAIHSRELSMLRTAQRIDNLDVVQVVMHAVMQMLTAEYSGRAGMDDAAAESAEAEDVAEAAEDEAAFAAVEAREMAAAAADAAATAAAARQRALQVSQSMSQWQPPPLRQTSPRQASRAASTSKNHFHDSGRAHIAGAAEGERAAFRGGVGHMPQMRYASAAYSDDGGGDTGDSAAVSPPPPQQQLSAASAPSPAAAPSPESIRAKRGPQPCPAGFLCRRDMCRKPHVVPERLTSVATSNGGVFSWCSIHKCVAIAMRCLRA